MDEPFTPPIQDAWYEKSRVTFVVFSYWLWIYNITRDIKKQRKLRRIS